MHVDDAVAFIVDFLRTPRRQDVYQTFGYEIKLEIVILSYLKEVEHLPEYIQRAGDEPRGRELAPIFFEGAWELCRRGILRPSVQTLGGQGSADGTGYCVTALGRRWIADRTDQVLLIGPDRISELFGKLADRLGSAFLLRATEAARCHSFGLHVACCAMCGAAAESILLLVATTKTGDEAATLASYRTANGRRRVTDSIVGQARPTIAGPFRSATGLLSYWRDEAAHGMALARLLSFAQFVTNNWGELTTR